MSTFGILNQIVNYSQSSWPYGDLPTVTAGTKVETTKTINSQNGNSWNLSTRTVTLSDTNKHSNYLTFPFSITEFLKTSPNGLSASQCYGLVREIYYRLNASFTRPGGVTVNQYWEIGPSIWDAEITEPRVSQAESPIYFTPWTNTYVSGITNLQPTGSSNQGTIRQTFYKTGNNVIAFTNNYESFPNFGVSTTTEGPQYAGFNDFDYVYIKVWLESSRTSGSGAYSFDVTVNGEVYQNIPSSATTLFTLGWVGKNYNIDGLNGDTLNPLTNSFSITGIVTNYKNASCNIQTDFSLSENSVSVITGVEKTLENSFSLSAEAKINRFATISLSTQADFSATTFNFRFADPLSLQSDYSLSSAGGIIRNLSSGLILSTDTDFTQTAGLIYDISVDYTWDDFAIDGKFTDNLLAGGIQYTWDGVDYYNWGTWPNDNWEQTDISWDEWPSDTWNGSERIVTEFNTQNTGNAKRGGIGNLLSTTALSENAAKLKTGASTLISEFLCDGSPSGKMGGSSTMVSDFIVNSFANYIINNAQNIDGAFNATLLANYIAKFLWSARSDFNLDITPTFKPGGVTNAQCIAVVDALANYKINNPQNIESAFDPEFTARLFFTTDPYQIYRVLQETRQIFVDAESRGIEIPEEIRLNSIPAENRDWLVPQETRNMKLRIPPMVDRTTTPKVRRE
jgi:hypothetical protein